MNDGYLEVIRRAEKLNAKRVSKTTNSGQENKGESCKGFSLGDRAIGYFKHEVEAEVAALAAGYDREQMKELVKCLYKKRQGLLKNILAEINVVEGISHE